MRSHDAIAILGLDRWYVCNVADFAVLILPLETNVQESPLFTDFDSESGLGGWGDPANDHQVPTGGFKDFVISYPIAHRLRRQYTPQTNLTLPPAPGGGPGGVVEVGGVDAPDAGPKRGDADPLRLATLPPGLGGRRDLMRRFAIASRPMNMKPRTLLDHAQPT